MNLAPYRKLVTAVVTALLGWAAAVVVSQPAHITAGEWVQLGTVVAIGFGVYYPKNDPVE